MEPLIFLLFLFISIVCGYLSANLAKKKGYSWGVWFACGIFFGVLGLIAAAGLPLKPSGFGFIKKCPECAESVKAEALVCRYCGLKFNRDEVIAKLGSIVEKKPANCSEVVGALAAMKDESTVPYLEKALSYSYDLEHRVRVAAVKALIDIGTIPALIIALKRGTDTLRERAVEMLRDKADPSAVPALIDLLSKSSFITERSIWVSAISLLIQIQDESAIRGLISSLSNEAIRGDVIVGLEKIGSRAIPYLEDAAKQEKRIKKFAEKIIAEIHSK